MNKAEFDRAMDALLLEVDESIVRDIRRIGHGYAQQERKEILDEFQNQKFFHALPPTAKDEFYDWINQQEESK